MLLEQKYNNNNNNEKIVNWGKNSDITDNSSNIHDKDKYNNLGDNSKKNSYMAKKYLLAFVWAPESIFFLQSSQ